MNTSQNEKVLSVMPVYQMVATIEALENQGVSEAGFKLLRSDKELAKRVAEIIKAAEPSDIKSVWERIYKKYFDYKVNFADVIIPENYDPEKHFCVIVAKGIKMNKIIKGLKKHFDVYLYADDLDASVTKNDRVADKNYAILFNKRVEADDEYKNMSANKLAEMEIKGITLLERLLLEAFYYDATGQHLDINNWTLCSGSRGSDGSVPRVFWHSGDSELDVGWHDPGDASGLLRSRAVVSC